MTLLWPIWLVAAVALLVLAVIWRGGLNNDGWRRVMAAPVLTYLREGITGSRVLNMPLLAGAIAAVALAGPAMPSLNEPALRHAQGWFIAIDVSQSMGLEDIAPSRLAAARDAAIELVTLAGSRPVGLIVYAGDAYLAGPLTFDKQHTLAFLESLKPGVVPLQGSNLKRALALSSSVIRQSELSRARLFVLSDATANSSPLLPVAAALARDGHRLDLLTFATAADSERPAVFSAAEELAQSGGGIALTSNPLGEIDLSTLTEASGWKSERFVQSSLATLVVQNLSHWVLLLAMPLVLLMFGRRNN